MTNQNAPLTAYFFNLQNVLIVRFNVESMDAARAWAKEYNRDPSALGQCHFIGNYPKVPLCTRLTAVYPPSPTPLFPEGV